MLGVCSESTVGVCGLVSGRSARRDGKLGGGAEQPRRRATPAAPRMVGRAARSGGAAPAAARAAAAAAAATPAPWAPREATGGRTPCASAPWRPPPRRAEVARAGGASGVGGGPGRLGSGTWTRAWSGRPGAAAAVVDGGERFSADAPAHRGRQPGTQKHVKGACSQLGGADGTNGCDDGHDDAARAGARPRSGAMARFHCAGVNPGAPWMRQCGHSVVGPRGARAAAAGLPGRPEARRPCTLQVTPYWSVRAPTDTRLYNVLRQAPYSIGCCAGASVRPVRRCLTAPRRTVRRCGPPAAPYCFPRWWCRVLPLRVLARSALQRRRARASAGHSHPRATALLLFGGARRPQLGGSAPPAALPAPHGDPTALRSLGLDLAHRQASVSQPARDSAYERTTTIQ